MIAKAALEVDVGATWATFLQRKAFMTGHPHFGLILGDDGIRFPPLRGMMASLLFIDAVSIFDAATETQMTKAKHRKLSTFDRRLKVLASEKKLVNAAACHRVRMRRNQVAHKAIEVTENELDQAIAVLHGELQGWGIVGPPATVRFPCHTLRGPSQQQGGVQHGLRL